MFLIFFYQLHFYTSSFFLVTISPPLSVAAPPLSFWRQSLESTETSSLAMRETQPPSAGRINFTLYLFYMDCITNIQKSCSSTRREDVTIAKLPPSVQLTILAPWPIPSCSHSMGAVFCVFIDINCMHPLVLD
jgi:hypothetical protein